MSSIDELDKSIAEMSDEEIMAAIREKGIFIGYIEQTPERCLAAVKQNGTVLPYIKLEFRTEELYIAAMEQNSRATRWVPDKLITKDICLKCIRDDGFAFEYLPDRFKKPEFYIEAIKYNPRAFKFVPKTMQTEEMCIKALTTEPSIFRFISKKILTQDICTRLVMSDGTAIHKVPNKFKTKDVYFQALIQLGIKIDENVGTECFEDRSLNEMIRELQNEMPTELLTIEFFSNAVKTDGRSLHSTPKQMRTDELCLMAVKFFGKTLYSVPAKKRTKELCLMAVKQDGKALKFVPRRMVDEPLCVVAVSNYPCALKDVPDKYKTCDLCSLAIQNNWRAFNYALDSMYTADACFDIYEQMVNDNITNSLKLYDDEIFRKILERLPEHLNDDARIFKLRKQFDNRSFKIKKYNKNKKQFITELGYIEPEGIKIFDTFIEFYNYLYGNLEGADLTDYDFEGIDFEKYNFDGAVINNKVLANRGIYDDSFYRDIVSDIHNDTYLVLSKEKEVTEARIIIQNADITSDIKTSENILKINYISDIHINYKLLDNFPESATEQEITQYIKVFVEKMVGDQIDSSDRDVLLVSGDTSFNFKTSSIFYKVLREAWIGRIIVTLGNHELWGRGLDNIPLNSTERSEYIIFKYRKMLKSLNINLLQNELFLSNGKILSEEQLQSIDSEELRNICLRNSYVILGGLGYSGFNPNYNATHKIYRETITSLNEDIKQTKRFEFIYEKMKEILGDKQVIVLTHTPKENWSDNNYNPNWIYVNGHTHFNKYCCTEEMTVYADNQIGYHSTSVGLKHFYVSGQYDIFEDYLDGIHIISREAYHDFNRGKNIMMQFNRKDGTINMLKNYGTYCFIFKSESGKYYLLNGGMIKNLEQKDLNYYFERMPIYFNIIKRSFKNYHKTLKLISDAIKKIGGSGTIHGCIIDINFFNHIYVNPWDGKITPYYATSAVDKFTYSDVKTLLMYHEEDLFDNYMKLLDKDKSFQLLEGEIDSEIVNIPQFVPETEIYKNSRIMRSIQYFTDDNVIRIWDDNIASMITSDLAMDFGGNLPVFNDKM